MAELHENNTTPGSVSLRDCQLLARSLIMYHRIKHETYSDDYSGALWQAKSKIMFFWLLCLCLERYDGHFWHVDGLCQYLSSGSIFC